MAEQSTTPIGWKTDNVATRKRRFYSTIREGESLSGCRVLIIEARDTYGGKEFHRDGRIDRNVTAHT